MPNNYDMVCVYIYIYISNSIAHSPIKVDEKIARIFLYGNTVGNNSNFINSLLAVDTFNFISILFLNRREKSWYICTNVCMYVCIIIYKFKLTFWPLSVSLLAEGCGRSKIRL